jgi:hypothetical protein
MAGLKDFYPNSSQSRDLADQVVTVLSGQPFAAEF